MMPSDLDDAFFESDIVVFGVTALVPNIHSALGDLVKKAKRHNAITVVNTMWYNTTDFYNMNAFKTIVSNFKSLGLEVYVTELDMAQLGDANAQKTHYQDFITACRQAGVDQVYFWGLYDGGDLTWRTNDKPLLFDASLSAKPAYYGVQTALINMTHPINSINSPTTLNPGQSVIVSVNYLTIASSDVHIEFYNPDCSVKYAEQFANVTSGTATINFTVSIPSTVPLATGYHWRKWNHELDWAGLCIIC